MTSPNRDRLDSERRVLVGLIGAAIQASRSPALHEREAAEQGLTCLYQLIDLERHGLGPDALDDLLTAAQRMGFRGVNVTHPCKQAVIAHLDALSDEARALGAVNTVLFEDGRRVGHNTDSYGFAESFRRFMPDAPRDRVVQLGAGGAGAAVAAAALALGVGVLALADPDAAKLQALVDQLNRRFGAGRARVVDDLAAAVRAADGLINATPIGMANHPGLPLPQNLLRRNLWVADIVYFPLETALLRTARALGARTLAGGGMAVFQAAQAFRLFTGRRADADRMLRHFESM
ncbi:MAG TPA: shikimate dehydrogenase [Candidatus Sulfotelmatobacter sp.]|nr:shikimate dehydrogenase [Candidatus Sulfotelmatobacter sp.]